MELTAGLILLFIVIAAYELRIKKPDQIILYDKKGTVEIRTGKFYPRHFSLALPAVSHSMLLDIECEAKGKLEIIAKISLSVAADKNSVSNLIRVGGWTDKAVQKSSKELQIFLLGIIREYTEKYGIEELSSEGISKYVHDKSTETLNTLGIEIVSLSVQSIDPVNKEIAVALRQQEEARIKETTAKINQQARIEEAKLKIEADEKIAAEEHNFKIKQLELKQLEDEREDLIANRRIEEELRRSNLRLEYDKKELSMLKENPELLMLTPQVARLAEASQGLKNAKTVVSLAGSELEKGSEFSLLLQGFLHNMMNKQSSENDKK